MINWLKLHLVIVIVCFVLNKLLIELFYLTSDKEVYSYVFLDQTIVLTRKLNKINEVENFMILTTLYISVSK